MIDPILASLGFFIGTLVGLTGVGGGALLTPLLILVAGVRPMTAIGMEVSAGANLLRIFNISLAKGTTMELGPLATAALVGWRMFRQPNAVAPRRPTGLPWGRILGTLVVLSGLVVTFLVRPPLDPHGFAQMAVTFSGLSLLLLGGGYVFIPMIQGVVVTNYGWLSTQQFLDGIAFSQVTPGPILVIATFIAQKVITEQYGLLLGLLGALVGTIGIFTPPAVLMITASLALDDMKQSPGVQAAMRGIRCGVLGMIIVAALVILHTSLPAWPGELSLRVLGSYLGLLWPTLGIFVAALVALVRYRVDVVWIIPSAGLIGLLLY